MGDSFWLEAWDSVVYACTGSMIPAALVAQAFIGAATSVLLALAARRLFLRTPGAVLAGTMYAVHSGAVFYDGLLSTPSLTNFFLAAALTASSRVLIRTSRSTPFSRLTWSMTLFSSDNISPLPRSNWVKNPVRTSLFRPPNHMAIDPRSPERARGSGACWLFHVISRVELINQIGFIHLTPIQGYQFTIHVHIQHPLRAVRAGDDVFLAWTEVAASGAKQVRVARLSY